MNGFFEGILRRQRLVLPMGLLLALTGLLSWFTMPRQEDPTMPDRFGIIVAAYPGADAETIERLITDPIEEHLAQVAQVQRVRSTSRTDVAILRVRLRDTVYATEQAWSEVEDAIEAAQADLPKGAVKPDFKHKIGVDQHAVVLALTGSLDRRALLAGAKTVKRKLLTVPGVSAVVLIADPKEQIVIELNDAQVNRLGIAPGALVETLRARNTSLPSGVLNVHGRNTSVKAQAEFQSLEDLAQTDISLPAGGTVPLSEIAKVRFGPLDPSPVRMRFAGAPAVGVAVVPQLGIDTVILGERIRAAVSQIRPAIAPLSVDELSFQPDYVSARLSGLGRSLLMGIAIVAALLILAMGIRLGLVVASVVPLVALAALGVYAMGGGILHQISVSALIIALGMLVDNAIVIAESVQQKMDSGLPPKPAATEAVRELALPLATATGTTLAAFVPMYMSSGNTGDFTRAIPIVIMLTLFISYLFAIFVTPTLAAMFLKPRRNLGPDRLARAAGWAGRVATHYPWWVLGVAAIALGLSGSLASRVGQNFFPTSGRDQLVVEVVHPEGTHIEETDASARAVESYLLKDERVRKVSSFVGRSAPRFYYNLPNRPGSPHFAHVVVQTQDASAAAGLAEDLRAWAQIHVPQADVVPRQLEQGPPVSAPVELRIQGDNLDDMHAVSEDLMRYLRTIPGVRDVAHNQGMGVPSLQVKVHDAAAARRGLTRRDVATTLLGQTRGLPVGALRSGPDPVPIVVRSAAGEKTTPDRLASLSVPSRSAGLVPLAQVTQTEVVWKAGAIHRRNRSREVSVTAHLAPNQTFGPVLKQTKEFLQTLELAPGISVSFGGAAEGSGEANASLAAGVPIGILLLLLFLMLEFNSFRRVFLILLTVPLAATGVIPGLLIANQPFGFMSLLGVVALIGVVVNNAIVLIDVIEVRRKEGLSIKEAVAASVSLRARPILLTTATTVAGLMPLALSPSPLWPPLASAMIAGLLASTFLTLLVIPAAYVLLFPSRSMPKVPWAAAVTSLGLLLVSGPAFAAPTLSEVLRRGAEQPQTKAAESQRDAARARAQATWRLAYLPVIGAEASVKHYDRLLSLQTPVGDFPFGSQSSKQVGVKISQPIVDLPRLLTLGPAATQTAEAADYYAQHVRRVQAASAASKFFDVLSLRAALESSDALQASLETRAKQLKTLVTQGRVLQSDLLRVELALADVEQDRLQYRAQQGVAQRALGEALGEQEPQDAGSIDLRTQVPTKEEALERALAARADLLALRKQYEAAQTKKKGLWLELAPKLEAQGLFVYDSGLPYDTNHYFQGTLNAVWTPFVAGTRFARSTAHSAQVAELSSKLDGATRGLRIQIEAVYADIETSLGAIHLARRAFNQATEAARVERLRYEEGQITMSELLEVEAILRAQTTRKALAKIDLERAHLALRLATARI